MLDTYRGDSYDVLLLGGSVLHPSWGTVAEEFEVQLSVAGRRKVRLFNLAVPAHTSRDSAIKYLALQGARFDLVLYYHGTNDVRPNNVPPKLFRPDYSHYSWYAGVNAIRRYHGTSLFAVPPTVTFVATRLGQVLKRGDYAPTHAPRENWLRYGSAIRSVEPFEHNVASLIEEATRRKDRLVLMTFATRAPRDRAGEQVAPTALGDLRAAFRLWGRVESVVAAVEAHNDVVRRKAREHGDAIFVDQAQLLRGRAAYFSDACHLTKVGSATFARHVVHAVLAAERTRRSEDGS